MPSQDSHVDSERDRDTDKDRDKDREFDANEKSDRTERGAGKQKPSTSQKTKDLSHVPCKFFKVGACTAGSSCPFSHTVPEPGHKEVCAWFVKGNCKFGHKCALAHILPGQSMAMDRKNKKAAQAAAAGTAAAEKGATGFKEGSRDASGKGAAPRRRDPHHTNSDATHGGAHGSGTPHSGSARNASLFSGGSTAPTRILRSPSASTSSTRPPINMPLKATISPSAPAPPLKDTDFASFAALDEMEGVDMPTKRRQDSRSREGTEPVSDAASNDENLEGNFPKSGSKPSSPVILPTSAPRPSVPLATTDFGPIGSPPSVIRLGGSTTRKPASTLSPGTSPRSNGAAAFLQQMNNDVSLSPPAGRNAQSYLPSSPFSAPGAQSIFLSSSLNTGDPGPAPSFISGTAGNDHGRMGTFNMGGVAASLGTGMALLSDDFDDVGIPISRGSRLGRGSGVTLAVGDEDFEEFIPSSLSDLLTPEERRRRLSRSGQHPQAQQQNNEAPISLSRPPNVGDSLTPGAPLGHRYSRSVPAPSLLGDLKSIWSDATSANQRQGTPLVSESGDTTGLQVPSSKPLVNGGRNPLLDDMGLSISVGSASSINAHNVGLSPSNASAAFLPGLHHHYLKAKQQAQLSLAVGAGPITTSGRNGTSIGGGTGPARGIRSLNQLFPGANPGNNNTTSSNVGVHTHGATTHTYRLTPSPFDLTQPHHHQLNSDNRASGAPGLGSGIDDLLANQYITSPSTRALQSHAPGQSLPQGLAAGLSRIHALPPLPGLTSPGTSITSDVGNTSGPYEEWQPSAPPAQNMLSGAYASSFIPAGGPSGAANANIGRDPNISRMTYSAIARGTNVGDNSSPPASARTGPAGGRYRPGPGATPPHPADDDELFAMDG